MLKISHFETCANIPVSRIKQLSKRRNCNMIPQFTNFRLYSSNNALVQNQIRTPDVQSSGLYLHLILVEADDSQGFSHHLPIAAIVDGAHFGAVTLRKKIRHVT